MKVPDRKIHLGNLVLRTQLEQNYLDLRDPF